MSTYISGILNIIQKGHSYIGKIDNITIYGNLSTITVLDNYLCGYYDNNMFEGKLSCRYNNGTFSCYINEIKRDKQTYVFEVSNVNIVNNIVNNSQQTTVSREVSTQNDTTSILTKNNDVTLIENKADTYKIKNNDLYNSYTMYVHPSLCYLNNSLGVQLGLIKNINPNESLRYIAKVNDRDVTVGEDNMKRIKNYEQYHPYKFKLDLSNKTEQEKEYYLQQASKNYRIEILKWNNIIEAAYVI